MLLFLLFRDEQYFHVCPKRNRTSCSFSLKDQHVLKATYFTVKVTSSNALGTFTTRSQVVQMTDISKCLI